jgi:hypothetical protein
MMKSIPSLLLLLVGNVECLSLFRTSRAQSARSLVKHLKQGRSRIAKDVSVVALGHNECGIQLKKGASSAKEVVYVDRQEFLTSKRGLETTVGRTVQRYFARHEDIHETHGDFLPSIYIAIYLCLHQEGKLPRDQFSLYMETLPSPEALQHLPLFWSQDMLQELQCSVVKEAVDTRRREWEEEYTVVREALTEANLSEDEFPARLDLWYWARSICTSRGFTDQSADEVCLVPYVDMMNHIGDDEDVNDVIKCSWKIDSSGYHLMLPEEEKNAPPDSSTRLEISYGTHSNADLLINYGFSLLDEDGHRLGYEKAMISLRLPESVNGAGAEALWEADGMGDSHDVSRNVTVFIGGIGPMQSVLSLCRVASTKEEDLSTMREAFLKRGETTPQTEDGLVPQMGATLCRSPFSINNEIRAMQMFQRSTRDGLQRYATTLAQDDLLLSRSDISHQLRNALTLRRGEKQILQHFNALAALALQFLERTDDFETYKIMLEVSLMNEEMNKHPLLSMAT